MQTEKKNAEKTLQTLKKLSDFPFYCAVYHGSYKIPELSAGMEHRSKDISAYYQAFFKEKGYPVPDKDLNIPEKFSVCSAFACGGEDGTSIVGKNLDWKKDPILLLKTAQENSYKTLSLVNLSFCDIFRQNSAKHNLLFSPYVPMDGINEKGLIISMLSVQKPCVYPFDEKKTSVGDFHVIRIILDTCSSIEDAIAVFNEFNILQTGPLPIHYLIHAEGRTCIVELDNGRLKASATEESTYLTNFIKLNNKRFKKERRKCSRYKKMEDVLHKKEGLLNEQEADELLVELSVFTPEYAIPSTIWSVLYYPEKFGMKIKIGQDNTKYKVCL